MDIMDNTKNLVPTSFWKTFCSESRNFFGKVDPRLTEEGKQPVVCSVMIGLIALGADLSYLRDSEKLASFREPKRTAAITRLVTLGYITNEGPQRTKILNLILDNQDLVNPYLLKIFENANQAFMAKGKKPQIVGYHKPPTRLDLRQPPSPIELKPKQSSSEPEKQSDEKILELTPVEFALAHYVDRHLSEYNNAKTVTALFSKGLIQNFMFDGIRITVRGSNFIRLRNKLKKLIPALYPGLYGDQVSYGEDNWNKSVKMDYNRFKEGLKTFCTFNPNTQEVICVIESAPDYNEVEPELFTQEDFDNADPEELAVIAEVVGSKLNQANLENESPDPDALEDFEKLMLEGLLRGTFVSVSARQRIVIADYLARPGADLIFLKILREV